LVERNVVDARDWMLLEKEYFVQDQARKVPQVRLGIPAP